MARRRPSPPKTLQHSVILLLLMGLGASVTLGAFVWLALAYAHEGLLAVLLPTLPIIFNLLTEQGKRVLDAYYAEFAADADEPDATITPDEDIGPHDGGS